MLMNGMMVIVNDYNDRKISGKVVSSFHYGRKENAVMYLNFQIFFFFVSDQTYSPKEKENTTELQEHVIKKLEPNDYPFTFNIPQNFPASVTLQPGPEDKINSKTQLPCTNSTVT